MKDLSRRSLLRFAAAAPLVGTAGAALAQTTHTVRITDFAFVPASLTIAAGDTVVFVNEDSAPHTATATNGAFDTGRLSRGGEARLTFPGAGRFDYFCELHPRMTATLIVQ